jgi:hypothetical protein
MQPGPTAVRAFRSTDEPVIINFGHPSYDWPWRPVLSFRDRKPSALTARPSSSSNQQRFLINLSNNQYLIKFTNEIVHECGILVIILEVINSIDKQKKN